MSDHVDETCAASLAFIHDDCRGGTCSLGVRDLHVEAARSLLKERNGRLAGKTAKSSRPQPLLLLFGGRLGLMTRSTGTSVPVAVPSGVPVSKRLRRKSTPLTNVLGSGLMRTSLIFFRVRKVELLA